MNTAEFGLQMEWLLRIIIAGICGAMIGYERKSHNNEAGIRTHMIVALGAALLMIISKYGFTDVIARTGIGLDPSRIAAQIVSGVGFLGAGMIFMRNNSINGLTTAAGIWTTSGIGMAIGCGLYLIGVLSAVIVVVVQVVMHRNYHWLKESWKDEISFVVKNDPEALSDVRKRLEALHFEILNVHVVKHKDTYQMEFVVNFLKGYDTLDLLRAFDECSYIIEFDV